MSDHNYRVRRNEEDSTLFEVRDGTDRGEPLAIVNEETLELIGRGIQSQGYTLWHDNEIRYVEYPHDTVFGVAVRYCDAIKDGRTQDNMLTYLKDEVDELTDEVAGAQGTDGITGEAIDVIACAVDLIRSDNPNDTITELEERMARYMATKCEKWAKNVEARKYPHQRHPDLQE